MSVGGTVGTQKVTAAELKQLLDKSSIKAISSYVQLADLRNDLDNVIAFNRAIGNTTLVVPYLAEKGRPTDAAGWTVSGHELGEISKRVRAQGMHLAYHNHDFELVAFDGKTGLELLFAAAGPDLETELDLAWSPVPATTRRRCWACSRAEYSRCAPRTTQRKGQAKDEGGFAAVGQGVPDWNAILSAAAAAGVQQYIIEHDQPRDPALAIRTGANLPASTPARQRTSLAREGVQFRKVIPDSGVASLGSDPCNYSAGQGRSCGRFHALRHPLRGPPRRQPRRRAGHVPGGCRSLGKQTQPPQIKDKIKKSGGLMPPFSPAHRARGRRPRRVPRKVRRGAASHSSRIQMLQKLTLESNVPAGRSVRTRAARTKARRCTRSCPIPPCRSAPRPCCAGR